MGLLTGRDSPHLSYFLYHFSIFNCQRTNINSDGTLRSLPSSAFKRVSGIPSKPLKLVEATGFEPAILEFTITSKQHNSLTWPSLSLIHLEGCANSPLKILVEVTGNDPAYVDCKSTANPSQLYPLIF